METGQPLGAESLGAEPSSPLEALQVFVAEHVPESLVDIVEALHDAGQTPAEQAMAHMEHANEAQMHMIEALSHGDVDAGSAYCAEAEAAMQSSVDVLHPSAQGGEHLE